MNTERATLHIQLPSIERASTCQYPVHQNEYHCSLSCCWYSCKIASRMQPEAQSMEIRSDAPPSVRLPVKSRPKVPKVSKRPSRHSTFVLQEQSRTFHVGDQDATL
jgi:hypothetical protein